MRILFASSEVSPIAKTGGLGDVVGALPKTLRKFGHEPVVVMPFYRQAREWFERTGAELVRVGEPTIITWGNWSAEATFLRATLPGSDVPVILVVNDYFFNRDHIYDRRLDGFDDYFLRYTFFCRAAIRACELLEFAPDLIHAHDWHTALLPVYLHSGLRGSPYFQHTRSVFTIHNLNYQGMADPAAFGATGLHSRYWAPDALEHFGAINPMKGGIILADQVTTVSPNYAREIQTHDGGAGLDGILRSLSFKLTGILNGIDVEEWNPATDPQLRANYDREVPTGKTLCKRELLREANLKYKSRTPLMIIVSRLVSQKGFQHLIPLLPTILRTGAQLVVLGSGEPEIEDGFRAVEAAMPDNCKVWIGFDNELAHRIYGGGDILLMPSVYEPCGLNQMYALRYGTVPVVRWTGGLADSVVPFDGSNPGDATGFAFLDLQPRELHAAVWLSILNYRDVGAWKTLVENGMTADFSWERSARQYENVYRSALSA